MDLDTINEEIKNLATKLEHDRFLPKNRRIELLSKLDNLLIKRKMLETAKLKQYAMLADLLDKKEMYKLANEIDEVIKYSTEMGKLLSLDEYRDKKNKDKESKNKEKSIISGTKRPPRLVDAFMKELERIDNDRAYDIYKEYGSIFSELNDHNYDNIDPDELDYLIYDEIIPALNEVAPEGLYFGSHRGDSSNFGWWAK